MDSEYAGDITHRKSVTVILIEITGEYMYYKTRFQATVSLRSIEAECIAACEVAQVILYIRSIIDDIIISHDTATTLFGNNGGELMMSKSGQPTK